jgi:TatD DNase family protein
MGRDLPESERTSLLDEARACGVRAIPTAGTDYKSSQTAIAIAENYHEVAACIGLHPWRVGDVFDGEQRLEVFRNLTRHPKVVAISEVGLDTEYIDTPLDEQRRVLWWFIQLAVERRLPVIAHLRAPVGDLVATWRSATEMEPRAAVHSFEGSFHEVEALLDAGFYVSLGPRSIRRVTEATMRAIPPERLLLDSDAYYEVSSSPPPHPAVVSEVAAWIAEIWGVDIHKVVACVARNFWQLLRTHG